MIRVLVCMVAVCAALSGLAMKLDQPLAAVIFVGCGVALGWIIGSELTFRKQHRERNGR